MKNKEKDFSTTIYIATKWSVITNVLRKFISPITNMVLARLLTPDAFGIVTTINMVISFTDIFTDAGFQKYLVQHEFESEEHLKKSTNVAFWTNLIISILLWEVIAVFRNPIASLVGSEGYGFQLMIAGLTIPLLSFSSIQQALFRRKFDFKGMFVPRLINSIIPIFVTIPLAYVTRNCWALIIGTLVSNMSDAILLTIKSKWKPELFYSLKELKEMFSFSVWTLLESLSIWLTINVDIFILGRSITSYYLGLYKTSITSVNQITTLITTTIIPVLFSALSRTQMDKKQFNSTFYSFQNKCAIILIPMSIGMFMYNDVITWILLGSQWMEAAHFIGLIGLMQAFTVLFANFASEVYRSKGEPKISFAVQIMYIICIIPTVSVGSKLGFEKLCFLRAGLMVIFVLMHLVVLKVRYKLRLKLMYLNIAQPIYASIIMGIIGLVLHNKIDSMIGKTVSIFICIMVYFFSCMIFPNTRQFIQGIISKVPRMKTRV